MPSRSTKQHKLMVIAAHTPGGYGGVPQSVGKKFAAADAGKPEVTHDRRGHNGSARGRRDMAGRKHRGPTGNGTPTGSGY